MKTLPHVLPLSLTVCALIAACSPQPEASPSAAATAAEAIPSSPAPTPVASTPPKPERPIPAKLTALGTEPFWSAKVADGRMTYTTPDTPDGATFPVKRRASEGGVIFAGVIDGKPIELEVSDATCSDGMSDTVYPFAVVRRIGPDIQRGCAR